MQLEEELLPLVAAVGQLVAEAQQAAGGLRVCQALYLSLAW